MSDATEIAAPSRIAPLIRCVRNKRIILDSELAALYGVPTKRLNEQLRRNLQRFPEDFAFQLTAEEWVALRSQIAALKPGRGGHRKYAPYAFTEHGALMAATVLNSSRAVTMSLYIVRAFVRMREHPFLNLDPPSQDHVYPFVNSVLESGNLASSTWHRDFSLPIQYARLDKARFNPAATARNPISTRFDSAHTLLPCHGRTGERHFHAVSNFRARIVPVPLHVVAQGGAGVEGRSQIILRRRRPRHGSSRTRIGICR